MKTTSRFVQIFTQSNVSSDPKGKHPLTSRKTIFGERIAIIVYCCRDDSVVGHRRAGKGGVRIKVNKLKFHLFNNF